MEPALGNSSARFAHALVALALGAPAPLAAHDIITSRFDYLNDVLPVLRRHCIRCHAPDGAAPFPLDVYREARPRAEAIRHEVLHQRMPPWFAADASAELAGADRLSAREIDIVMEWASGGAPAGKPAAPGTRPIAPSGSTADDVPIASPRDETPPDFVVRLPEIALAVGEERGSSALSVTPELDRPRHVVAWDFETAETAMVRAVELYRGAVTPTSFLGSRMASESRLEFAGAGALIELGEPFFVRVVTARPWDIGRETARATVLLRLWFAETPPAREVRSTAIELGALGIPADAIVLGLRPSAALRVVAPHSGETIVEIVAANERWPRTYRFASPVAANPAWSVESGLETTLGGWLFAVPRRR